MMTRILTPVVLLAASAAAAIAQPPEQKSARDVLVVAEEAQPTRHVTFADLNLASANGRRTLERRVRLAVDDVCGEALGPLPIHYAKQACFSETWHETKPQMTSAFERAQNMTTSGLAGAAIITVQAPR
jgi:UrcA family protein